jgi:hypothetical protein
MWHYDGVDCKHRREAEHMKSPAVSPGAYITLENSTVFWLCSTVITNKGPFAYFVQFML